ncbi:hypothetical protein D4S03_07180 [bacterium]|nr:MAG: hypothetical protein D4S03_07180 [bacterium]
MITDLVVTLLSGGQAMTDTELAAHIPDLAGQLHGADVLRLLLRLDRRFREYEGRWLLREGVSDPSQQIRQAAQAYFQVHPKGELLKHLIAAVAVQTGQAPHEIKKVILQTYRSVGGMILNQPKEHS